MGLYGRTHVLNSLFHFAIHLIITMLNFRVSEKRFWHIVPGVQMQYMQMIL